jgi:hypothetical protein
VRQGVPTAGARVEMTPEGRRHLVPAWQTRKSARVTTGVFLGLARGGFYWRVLRDEHMVADTYHPDFWRIVR